MSAILVTERRRASPDGGAHHARRTDRRGRSVIHATRPAADRALPGGGPRRIIGFGAFVALCAVVGGLGCAGPITVAEPASVLPRQTHSQTRVGMAAVDITPPPGLPPLGNSAAAKHTVFAGVRLRLFARALVIEDREGDRLALVVADLGQPSALLHRLVANRVAPTTGITADRLMLSVTHTHSGPGGYLATAFYNATATTKMLAGQDTVLTEFLVHQIAAAITMAFGRLEPAIIDVQHRSVPGITRNRSPLAFARNELPDGTPQVDDRLTMIRATRLGGMAIGAMFLFAGHPNILGVENDLWHGDVFGIAVRDLEDQARREGRPEDLPHFLFANTSVGDVSFRWSTDGRNAVLGHAIAARFARTLANGAWRLFTSELPDDSAATADVTHAFTVVTLPGHPVDGGAHTLADRPLFGAPVMAGSEEARSSWFPHWAREGMTGGDTPGHGPKLIAGGEFGQRVLHDVYGLRYAQEAPLQLVRVAGLTLVCLPVEPTTAFARDVRARVAHAVHAPIDDVVVVGLANEYLGYCTTMAEYLAQHYEGASTVYGPYEGLFFEEQMARLAETFRDPGEPTPTWPASLQPKQFWPGHRDVGWPEPGTGDVSRRAIPPSTDATVWYPEVEVIVGRARFVWVGIDPGRINFASDWLVRIERFEGRAWRSLNVAGVPQDDLGLNFAVRLRHANDDRAIWEATWYVPAGMSSAHAEVARAAIYRFAIAERKIADGRPVERFFSRPFAIDR